MRTIKNLELNFVYDIVRNLSSRDKTKEIGEDMTFSVRYFSRRESYIDIIMARKLRRKRKNVTKQKVYEQNNNC